MTNACPPWYARPKPKRSAPAPHEARFPKANSNTKAHPAVTDHALIRWAGRVYGFDIEALRAKLAEEVAPYAIAGVARVTVSGVTYCFREKTLTTVIVEK